MTIGLKITIKNPQLLRDFLVDSKIKYDSNKERLKVIKYIQKALKKNHNTVIITGEQIRYLYDILFTYEQAEDDALFIVRVACNWSDEKILQGGMSERKETRKMVHDLLSLIRQDDYYFNYMRREKLQLYHDKILHSGELVKRYVSSLHTFKDIGLIIFDFTHNFSNMNVTKDLPECFDKYNQLWEKSCSSHGSENKFFKVRLFIELSLISMIPVLDWAKN
jgi:hypothetical protein